MALVLLGLPCAGAGQCLAFGHEPAAPFWSVSRAKLRLFYDGVGAALFCWLMQANILAGISITNLSAEKAIGLTQAINHWMTTLFPAAIVVGLVVIATGIYRIVRLKPAGRTAS